MFGILIYVLVVNQISNLHKSYLAFHFMMMLWPLSQFIYHISNDPFVRQAAMGTGLCSLLSLGPGWLLFTRLFTQQSFHMKASTVWLAIAPVAGVTLSMVCLPQLWFSDRNQDTVMAPFGPMFIPYVLLIGSYFISTSVIMLRAIYKNNQTSTAQLKQLILLSLGMLIFIAGALTDLIVNVIRFHPDRGLFGMTSLGILLSDIIFVVVIQRYRVFEISSIARREVIDTMDSGIIVVDERDVVLDVNRGIQTFFHVEKGFRIDMKSLFALIHDRMEAERIETTYNHERHRPIAVEIVVNHEIDGRNKYVSLHISPIYDDKKSWVGRLLTFHDISRLRYLVDEMNNKNIALLERNQELMRAQEELYIANRKLEHLAVTDPLTGCYNRRFLMEQMERYFEHYPSKDHSFSLVMFDIDHFKAINDTYGHLAGDEALRWTSECVRSLLHDSDLLARYGGEEFAVFMPGVNGEEAHEFASQLTALLSQSVTQSAFGYPILVTISVGILASDDIEEPDPNEPLLPWILGLFDEADRLMYQAKENGRNCIMPVRTKNDHQYSTSRHMT
ncbi:diguanylate cyclase [Paenibacillus marinisediminis]